jgi:hypothetical protein
MNESLHDIAASLRARLEQEQAHAYDLRAQTMAAERRVKKIRSAIKLLESEDAPVKATRKLNGKRGRPSDWVPSPDKMLAVTNYLKVHADDPEGVTIPEIAAYSGLNKATTGRCITILRERDEVRLAGKKGQAAAYKLMTKVTS